MQWNAATWVDPGTLPVVRGAQRVAVASMPFTDEINFRVDDNPTAAGNIQVKIGWAERIDRLRQSGLNDERPPSEQTKLRRMTESVSRD
jgi:hypothetical protein